MTKNYFTNDELKCKCGCGATITDTDFKTKLNKAREIAGVPFVINSGARCPSHNKKVGGVASSAHTEYLAVDIAYKTTEQMVMILYGLYKAGFVRIGINLEKKFIHVDTSKKLPQVVVPFKY